MVVLLRFLAVPHDVPNPEGAVPASLDSSESSPLAKDSSIGPAGGEFDPSCAEEIAPQPCVASPEQFPVDIQMLQKREAVLAKLNELRKALDTDRSLARLGNTWKSFDNGCMGLFFLGLALWGADSLFDLRGGCFERVLGPLILVLAFVVLVVNPISAFVSALRHKRIVKESEQEIARLEEELRSLRG